MKSVFFLFFCSCTISVSAQSYDAEKVNKKAVDLFERAIDRLQNDQPQEAVPLLIKAIETDGRFVDAVLSLASVYGEMKDYKTAVEQFEKARVMDTNYFRFFHLPYSINLAGLGRFNDALSAINNFLSVKEISDRSRKSGEYRKRTYEFAVQYATNYPADSYIFSPVNLGDSVNSEKSEYYPSITINDSLFVFTRRGEGYREDFFECTILANKKYGKSKLIKGDINLQPSKGAINISQDGEWLLFTGHNFYGGYGDFDLYISYYTPSGWSIPENLEKTSIQKAGKARQA